MAIHTTGNSVSLTAVEHRNQTAALLPPFNTALGVRGGVHSGLNIAKTSGLGFTISPGRAVVEPATPGNGPYVVTVDSTVTMAFEPGDSTRNRIDSVCIKVDETAGVELPGSIVIVKGALTTGTAVAPATPAGHEALFQVGIPTGTSAGNGGWLTANRKDVRRSLVSIGSPIPVNSLTERNALAPYEGMQVMRLDLKGAVDRYVGGTWRGNTDWIIVPLDAGWQPVVSYTPLKVKLTADGNIGMISGEVKYTGSGTPAEGWIIGRIPAAAMTAGVLPEENCWVIGTDENYRGLVVIQITANGFVRVGPFPTGKVFMFQGTFPIKAS